jgi:hypothetical protein
MVLWSWWAGLPGAAFITVRAMKAGLAQMEQRSLPGRRIGCWMTAISRGFAPLKCGGDQTGIMKMP